MATHARTCQSAYDPVPRKTSYKIIFIDFSWISAILLEQLKTRLLTHRRTRETMQKEIRIVRRSQDLLYVCRKKVSFKFRAWSVCATVYLVRVCKVHLYHPVTLRNSFYMYITLNGRFFIRRCDQILKKDYF